MKENVYKNHKLAVYKSKEDILNQFGITEEEFENILLELNYEKKLAYTYYYGIDRPKMDLFDISELLHVSENVVKIYINLAEEFIKTKAELKNKTSNTLVLKRSFFNYFEEKDKDFVLEIIEEYKKLNHDYYKVLVKAYGENYNKLVILFLLSKDEIQLLKSLESDIKNRILLKNNKNEIVGKKMKKSFFDYFEEKDKDFILKIIEQYKEKNHVYYKTLVKAYGEHYDHLVEPSPLTKKEKNRLNNFKNIVKKKIATGSVTLQRTKKISFFDYFEEKDNYFVLEIIEQYKEKNHDYYKVLVKAYGEHYDHLVEPSPLTKEEKMHLKSLISMIRSKIKTGDSVVQVREEKISFFDYFDKKDHPFVLEFIEQYKEKNHIYYKVLVKAYGEHYDHLIEPSSLTKEEKIQLNNFRSSIKNKIAKGNTTIRRTMKISFLDYFEEKDHPFVLEIIEGYKKLNHAYYKVLVKAYGERYDHLTDFALLTKKEKEQLYSFRNYIKKQIVAGNTTVRRKNKKNSFFDYFDKKDYQSVLEIINNYKEKDHIEVI